MHKYLLPFAISFVIIGCGPTEKTSDQKLAEESEKVMQEMVGQVGLPKIKNFRELRLLKEILEMRDQEGLVTYTYIVDMHGKLHFLGQSIGYGLPYSTQFSNPQKLQRFKLNSANYTYETMPQAEPNGLFMPTSSSATWVMLKGSDGKLAPQYVEPQIMVFSFKLPDDHPLLSK